MLFMFADNSVNRLASCMSRSKNALKGRLNATLNNHVFMIRPCPVGKLAMAALRVPVMLLHDGRA